MLQWILPSYQYRRLSSHQLRLIKVEPSSSDTDLRFSVHTVDRNNVGKLPQYAAVSYQWGSGSADRVVHLDGRRFLCRPNLWWCLYYIRKHRRWSFLWVDAICIDQDNVSERNEQVALMDLTYKDAVAVYAWLGLEYHPSSWDAYKPFLMDDCTLETSIYEFADRPYWTRMWVVQELLLARSIWVICGGYCITWGQFKRLLGSTILHEGLAASPFALSRTVRFNRSLYELLTGYHRSGCKDPRDKVFAIMSLLPPSERAELGKVFPDYSLTEDDFVVLTLAHLVNWCGRSIEVDNDTLFQALNVESHSRRRTLLALANAIEVDTHSDVLPSSTIHTVTPDQTETVNSRATVRKVNKSKKPRKRLTHGRRTSQAWVDIRAFKPAHGIDYSFVEDTGNLFVMSGLAQLIKSFFGTSERSSGKATVMDDDWVSDDEEDYNEEALETWDASNYDRIDDLDSAVEDHIQEQFQRPDSTANTPIAPRLRLALKANQDCQYPFRHALENLLAPLTKHCGFLTRRFQRISKVSSFITRQRHLRRSNVQAVIYRSSLRRRKYLRGLKSLWSRQ